MSTAARTPSRLHRIERTAGWFARRIAGPGTGRPAPLAALRMALSMALPLALGIVFGRSDLGSVGAIAALFTAIIEPGGGYRRHAGAYAAVTVLNVVVVILAVAVSSAIAAAVVVMIILGLLAGMASAWGSVPTVAAPAPLALFILTQGLSPTPRMGEAVIAVLIGSGWVALLSIAPWPIAPFAPAEIAVGDAWLSVAALARDVSSVRLAATATGSIEEARTTVAAIRSRRAGWSDRSHRLWASLVAAQRVATLLAAVADDRRHEAADDATRAAMDAMLAEAAAFASALATNAVLPRAHPDLTRLDVAADAVAVAAPDVDGLTGPPLHQALVGQARVRTARRLALRLREGAEALDLPDPPAVHVPHGHPDDWRQRVRATLSWHSTAFRHGLRLGLACAASMGTFMAFGDEGLLGVTHGSWVTITLMVVLKPTLGDSLQSVVQRALGTAIGGVIAVAMLALLPTQVALSIGIVAVASIAAWLKPVNVMWYVVLFTPIPLVFAASTGRSGVDIVLERLTATGIACVVGIAVAALVWPTRGGRALPQMMADAMRTDATALTAIIAMLTGRAALGSAFDAQRRAALASDEATRAIQAELLESLTSFRHPRPVVALEAAVLRLPREMAALAARAWTHGVEIPGIDDVQARAVGALAEIAGAMEDARAPRVGDDLVAALDPAWAELHALERRGTPDVRLAAAVDGLDAILHAIDRIADDTATWAATADGDGRGLLARLLPHPRAHAPTPTAVVA